jgi:hypothetical protein
MSEPLTFPSDYFLIESDEPIENLNPLKEMGGGT